MIEVEVKSLIGDGEHANVFLEKLHASFSPQALGETQQRNCYFVVHDIDALRAALPGLLSPERANEVQAMLQPGGRVSLRTREIDGQGSILVIKVALDEHSSSNGIARREFEETFPMTLEELDAFLLAAGTEVQARWSRSRQTFSIVHEDKTVTVTLDKNAGYGYLAEFEIEVADPSDIPTARVTIFSVMRTLGLEELPQDRLERMFAHYNIHWREYYGTEKTFVID